MPPLQAYASALVFSPAHSLVRGLSKQVEPTWIRTKPRMERNLVHVRIRSKAIQARSSQSPSHRTHSGSGQPRAIRQCGSGMRTRVSSCRRTMLGLLLLIYNLIHTTRICSQRGRLYPFRDMRPITPVEPVNIVSV
jgi:hypothetical protein